MSTLERSYDPSTDFGRVRDFLIHTYQLTQTPLNWLIERWDYSKHFITKLIGPGTSYWEADIRLWENAEGEIVGVVNHEGRSGEAFLQVHPDYHYIEDAMIAWAEEHLYEVVDDQRQLAIWVFGENPQRAALLQARGYEQQTDIGRKFVRSLREPIPSASLPDGYTLRSLRPDDDLAKRCRVMGRAFGSDPLPIEIYQSLQQAPGYRLDQDLIVEAPDGTFAAFTLVWYEPMSQIGMFEPVGTDPDYRRLGLGRALMYAGCQMLREFGATQLYVGTGTAIPATRLYESTGFSVLLTETLWRKTY